MKKKSVKKILFVVDDKKLGGVSSLLEAILNKISIGSNVSIDLLILKNEGTMLNNIRDEINIINAGNIFNFIGTKRFKKLYISFLIKTNLVNRYISRVRKKS